MARGLNKVLLIGNLGADPEIKYATNGNAIANLRVATTESRKNREGEREEITEWHRVVMFGRQAELCKDYLKKGSRVYIEGRLQTRSWDDQSGKKNYMTEIVGFIMLMLDARGQEASPAQAERQGGSSFDSGQASSTPDFPEADDDLPF
ncbi:single-stranded DNA-binding protein [bacterium]|nr:single-stranded DNA-binding protein [bacterium]